MLTSSLATSQEQCLRDQTISADQPGSVLRDFGMLLDFLGKDGVESPGKYNLLPISLIGQLDAHLTRPHNLKLKRPQIKSHPYIQGLNLLLRASGLSVVERKGAKVRLMLDPAMLIQWSQLSPTEQYFNLLEAWLRIARADIFGDAHSSPREMLLPCVRAWNSTAENGKRFDTSNSRFVYVAGIGRDLYNLALLDLFGLMEVEQPSRPVAPWFPAGFKRRPFGDAVFTVLTALLFDSLGVMPRRGEDDEEEEEPLVPRFGVWQPLFQPYFPEWQKNLEIPRPEPRDGTFVFRVSLGRIWRLIAMPADATLDDLVSVILRSVDFDFDHLYEFTYRDRMGAIVKAVHASMEDGPCAEDIEIGTIPLEPGQSMELHYDFGDDWRFTVKLERIDPPGAKIKAPKILEKHGKPPEQYPSWE
ncbi:MAG: IS1096 element passenger TnpR family protein [Isosphaeraceae bacterium]